jgi:dipeptidyl-peptidase-4
MWQNSLEFIKKCVDNQVQVDYFVYPGHDHNVIGSDRMHLYKKLFQYYQDHL